MFVHDPLLNCRMRTTAFFRFVRASWSDSFTIFFNPLAPGTSTPTVDRSKRACTRLNQCPETNTARLASEMAGPSYQVPSRKHALACPTTIAPASPPPRSSASREQPTPCYETPAYGTADLYQPLPMTTAPPSPPLRNNGGGVSTVSWRIRQRSRIFERPKTSRVIENPAPETFHGDYHGNKENFSYCGRAHFFQAEDRQEKIPGCRTSAGASATRGGGMVEGQKR